MEFELEYTRPQTARERQVMGQRRGHERIAVATSGQARSADRKARRRRLRDEDRRKPGWVEEARAWTREALARRRGASGPPSRSHRREPSRPAPMEVLTQSIYSLPRPLDHDGECNRCRHYPNPTTTMRTESDRIVRVVKCEGRGCTNIMRPYRL